MTALSDSASELKEGIRADLPSFSAPVSGEGGRIVQSLIKEIAMNTSAVDSLLAQMRVAAQAAGIRETTPSSQAPKVDFSNVLKSSLDGVAKVQETSETMQKAFVMGDDRVSLSDTMIAMQKAGINFQATVQVRNKFIQAYNDIMNMQV